MRKSLLKLIEHFLQSLARIKIRREKPRIVAITGSYGKTGTKEAIYYLLAKKFGIDAGKNWGNMNSTLGLPLAILGLKKYHFGFGLIADIMKAKWNFFFYHLPKYLVLELGIDKPGEMKEMLSMFSPEIGVLTGVSETHLEELKNIDIVRREKILLLQSVKPGGTIIYPCEEKIENSLGRELISFGKNGKISSKDLKVTISGTSFDLKIAEKTSKINSHLLGEHAIQALLIAAAVAEKFGINDEEIFSLLEDIRPQPGRMNPIKIRDGIIIIDDSYNSNPKSAEEALLALDAIESKSRKLAVLGNMNELGGYTKSGHLRVGKTAGKVVDILVAVGDNAKSLVEGAESSGLSKDKIFAFSTTDDLISKVDKIIAPGDIILIKGSQNKVRLERLVKYLLADDQLAKKLLVRQEKKWQKK